MITQKWQLQDAKNRFSELVRKATDEGPQTVTKHGNDEVIILSVSDFRKLTAHKENIVDFFRKSPLAQIHLERDTSPPRKIEL